MRIQATSIIVISDDDNFTQAIQAVLEPYGFKVKVAGYCDSCIRFAADACPELILLDWKWQDLCSSKILNQIKTDELTRHIPVYVLVSDMPGSIIKQSKKLGAAGYFVKSPKHILAEITTKGKNKISLSRIENQGQVMHQGVFGKLANSDSRFLAAKLQVKDCIKQLQRYSWQFGFLLFDIDSTAMLADNFEQDTSNIILQREARMLSANTRSFDHIVCLGDKEILSIIVNVTSKKLDKIAARLKSLAETSFQIHGNPLLPKISVGAVMCQSEDNLESLFNRIH